MARLIDQTESDLGFMKKNFPDKDLKDRHFVLIFRHQKQISYIFSPDKETVQEFFNLQLKKILRRNAVVTLHRLVD